MAMEDVIPTIVLIAIVYFIFRWFNKPRKSTFFSEEFFPREISAVIFAAAIQIDKLTVRRWCPERDTDRNKGCHSINGETFFNPMIGRQG